MVYLTLELSTFFNVNTHVIMDVREQQGDQSTTNKCFIVVLKQNHDIKLQKQNTGNQLFSDPVVYLRNDWAVFRQ